MKIKNYLIILFLALLVLNINAQIINLNPDPDGDPWIAGDLPDITPEIQAKLDAIPEMVLSSISSTLDLPEVVDNSQNIFMRPIFSQSGGSCGQASGVGYDFTYEINWARNLPSSILENQYPTHYTWNFLNNGTGYGSWYYDGWDIIKENGCPNFPTWGVLPYNANKWMTGYDNYYSGMHNKVDSYWYINVGTPSGLETFKHWVDNHNADTEIGGLGCFAIYMSGVVSYPELPPESAEPGKRIISDWNSSTGGYHAMTFVGYNDNIKYDINGDGLFTNDMDTNGDGIVDMKDWEIGALKIANSWGLNWPTQNDAGYVYFPYRLLAKAGAITGHKVYVVIAKEEYSPELTVKVKVEYPTTNLDDPARRKLEFNVGYANNANQITPINYTDYSSFNNQGGYHPMQGINYDPIEVGLDFSYWYKEEDNVGKIFFIIDENEYPAPTNDGIIEYFSIIDYRWGEVFELYCDETNVAIVNNDETILSIDYDLIPHESKIGTNLSLFSDMVSRFNPTVFHSATLTVEDGVSIDMYDSEIQIESGSTLVLEDNATFLAKSGICKIIIDGNITVGSNVSFIAEYGAELEVILNNNSLQANFDNVIFENCKIISYANNLTLANSSFNDFYRLLSHRGIIDISNTDFSSSSTQSWLYLENTEDNNNPVTIANCNFSTTVITMVAIDMWNYNHFDISNNTIDGFYNGIQIIHSGYGKPKNQMIKDNNIINCNQRGILTFATRAEVYRNHITDNGYGVWFGDHSSIRLYGYSGAVSYPQTQEIKDNSSYEVYASEYSFPIYFRYNVIIDEDNLGVPSDPLVYHGGSPTVLKDVRYNCWGVNFDPEEDFYPGGYIWEPTWCPEIGGDMEKGPDEDMFEVANTLFETEDYAGAKSMYEMLVDQYPQSKFAKAAMQELFALEKFVSDDYSSLKQYYTTNSTIQSNAVLSETGSYMVSKCDVKLENWPGAISYYENIILNPENMEDSIFAIIDLGYVYFVMENGGYKSAYTGDLVQYKPTSKEQFIENRNYLLSLIPGDQMSETMKGNITGLKEGELLQNVPNPFKGTTQIWYKLESESMVQINVFNYTGQLIRTINDGTKTNGTHHIDFNATGLKNGIYFYSISVNGQTTDSKKMTVMK